MWLSGETRRPGACVFFRHVIFVLKRGFPQPTQGMLIMDVRHRGMEGIGEWVTDFEASPGAVTFWAESVIDLDDHFA
jgi:hypothetical protein